MSLHLFPQFKFKIFYIFPWNFGLSYFGKCLSMKVNPRTVIKYRGRRLDPYTPSLKSSLFTSVNFLTLLLLVQTCYYCATPLELFYCCFRRSDILSTKQCIHVRAYAFALMAWRKQLCIFNVWLVTNGNF